MTLDPSTSPGARRGRRAAPAAALCAVLAFVAAPARATPAVVRIELRASSEVREAQVTLGDVAELSGRDAGLLYRLAGLGIGQVPVDGEPVRLDRDRLGRWIRARAGLAPAQIAWAGAAEAEVRRAVRKLEGADLARHVQDAVREALSRDGLRAEVRAAPAPRDLSIPAGKLELRVRSPQPGTALAKRVTAWADVFVDGRFVRTVAVDLELAVFGPAYVAAQARGAGEALASAGLSVREVEWSGRTAPPLAPGSVGELRLRRPLAAGQLRLRRPLAAGQPVTRADVEPPPLVARGGWATLRSGQGLVRLEGRVEVLEDGRAGQAVRVKLPGATGAILAQVTGPGAVEVGP